MSWDVTIVHDSQIDDTPLGSREDVVRAIAQAVPGLRLESPPKPTDAQLALMPPFIREQALNPGLEASYDIDDLSIQFSALNLPILNWINLQIRGNDNPLPLLRSICEPNGWAIRDAYEHTIVDLTDDSDSHWSRYCEWRNNAFGHNMSDGIEN